MLKDQPLGDCEIQKGIICWCNKKMTQELIQKTNFNMKSIYPLEECNKGIQMGLVISQAIHEDEEKHK